MGRVAAMTIHSPQLLGSLDRGARLQLRLMPTFPRRPCPWRPGPPTQGLTACYDAALLRVLLRLPEGIPALHVEGPGNDVQVLVALVLLPNERILGPVFVALAMVYEV